MVMKFQEFCYRHPVFRTEELVAALGTDDADRGVNRPGSRHALLSYHVSSGHVFAVRKGVYWTVPPGMSPDDCPVDEFLVASKLTDDAIISHHAALSLLGCAYSAWNIVTYFTADKNVRSLSFRNIEYKPVAHPIELRKKKQLNWGLITQDRLVLNINLTNLERTCVDVLHRPELAGGFEEIWRSLEAAPYFNIDKVIEYAMLLDSANTNARLGFFLEQHKEKFSVKKSQLDILRKHKPSAPRKMSGSVQDGIVVPDWNLIVPAEVFNRSWEEF